MSLSISEQDKIEKNEIFPSHIYVIKVDVLRRTDIDRRLSLSSQMNGTGSAIGHDFFLSV